MLRRRSTTTPSATRPAAVAPTFERLEGRQMPAVSPVVAGTKIKCVNVSSGNLSTNQTRITVPFTGNITIADQSKIQLRGYALNPLSANLAQIKKVVNVVSAQVLSTDFNNDGVQERQYLEIITDRLMRKGGSIIFYEGAFTDDNGDTLAEHTRKTLKGQNKERFTLANRAFIPTNFNRFTNDIFAASAVGVPGSTDIPEGTVTANLDAFLGK